MAQAAVPNMDQATIEAGKLPAKETDTHIYFFGYDTGSKYDCFQQWYPSKFTEPALSDQPGLDHFPTSEHYMMAMKSRVMRDEETAKKITQAKTPAEAKTLGREVKNFNQQIWDAACDAVVERGNWLKFGQNDELAEILLSTGDKTIVEASPSDKIWGVGFDVNNAEGREDQWGANKLGKALMRVRERIRSGEKEGDWPRIVKLEGCTSCGSCGKPHSNLREIMAES
ncbi:DUF1768-domain-containing protein [Cystobasidium minutum MCA 4210]|uniref:DUF1768-domain-containing protein n=1 Tax=Cystobasidium minutum MCA 4210 TaxID=1397322 RepID=UPI0034CF7437|eukprot:jgi/Rhomi1/167118/fgenesh1_kg.2_\